MKALLGIAGGFVLTLAVFASGLAFATWLLAAKPVRQGTPAIGVSELWTKDAQPVDPQKQNLERIPAQQAAVAPAKAGEAVPSESTKADSGTQTTALATPAPPPAPQLQPLPDVSGPGQPAPGAAAAQQPAAADQRAQQQQLPAAHLQWCATRYRSYRPAENSYRSYSGELRPCISPYYDPAGDRTASTEAGQNDQAAANDRPDAMADDQMSDDQAEMEGYAPSSGGYATTYGGPPEEISPEAEAGRGQVSGRQFSGDHVDDCFSRYRSYDPRDNTYQPFDGGPRRQCE
ncbi:BA14K family protein [Mesorhizobium sp. B4-1-3]|uniref:BA14K family protein n=1 Tax=Mesorhizobium sp. B4-1-3 TaxID=2589889 RepID=UPI0011264EF8|nr:BA14K family protein [Mesorhizobium sp. B4-1-3]TPI11942.1 BA14K family protein [Mesorhizobium sp. B4-1-3]